MAITDTVPIPEAPGREGSRAWLVLAVGADRQHGGNDGYDDAPESRYGWDSTVPNHGEVAPGDAIVIWDKHWLIGASIIEEIEMGETVKPVYRCPHCERSGIKARRNRSPRFRCYKCRREFEEPHVIDQAVTTYVSEYSVGWVGLDACLSGRDLRALCLSPKSQLSLRPMHWDAFRAAVRSAAPDVPLTALEVRKGKLGSGGHRQVAVRVRRGQAGFRRKLLDEFDAVCAFTGSTPEPALEACHLYSYAAVGEHHDHGGLLLRRDVHRLFDLGHLAVDPTSMTIDVADPLLAFGTYAALNGRSLSVSTNAAHRQWLDYHWREHRPSTVD